MRLSEMLPVETLSFQIIKNVKPELESIIDTIEFNKKYTKTKENILILFQNKEYSPEEVIKLQQVILLMLYLHIDQKERPDWPYVQHTSWVMQKISDWLLWWNIDAILAWGLHDSVEDQLDKLIQLFLLQPIADVVVMRQKVIELLWMLFGDSVSTIVAWVTNPIEDDTLFLSREEKIDQYTKHVIEATQYDNKILLCKLSDFNENGFNLSSVKSVSRRLWLSQKYFPLYDYFIGELKQWRLQRLKTKEYIDQQLILLEAAKVDASIFINQYSNDWN
jgi:(p)ppGpp synthase/HD superfamily hydrolase